MNELKVDECDREVDGRTVTVQSCWLEQDGFVNANVGIDNGLRSIHRSWRYHHIGFSSANEWSYDGVVDKRHLGQWAVTFDDYNQFIKRNFAAIHDLIVSLLGPDERDVYEDEPMDWATQLSLLGRM